MKKWKQNLKNKEKVFVYFLIILSFHIFLLFCTFQFMVFTIFCDVIILIEIHEWA